MTCRRLLLVLLTCCALSRTAASDEPDKDAGEEAVRNYKLQLNAFERRQKLLGQPLLAVNGFDQRGIYQVIRSNITLEQLAMLYKLRPSRGGLSQAEKPLFELACNVVYQADTEPTVSRSNNTLIKHYSTNYYNMLGMPIRVINHSSKYGSVPSTRIEIIEPTIHGDDTLSVRARFEYVEPAVFYGAILKNKKCLKVLEDTGLKDELTRYVNQIIVLNSTIENGQLVPMKPGFNVTPKRYMSLRSDQEGKITVELEDISKDDRQKLKDAHNNAGEFKDVKGVPVGAVLASDD
ncbi:hypothetical protein GC176_19105 [bacterium]|nr:hypothetical protein [bacterium]